MNKIDTLKNEMTQLLSNLIFNKTHPDFEFLTQVMELRRTNYSLEGVATGMDITLMCLHRKLKEAASKTMNDINTMYKEIELSLPTFIFNKTHPDYSFLDHVRNSYKCGKNLERTAAAMGLSLTTFTIMAHSIIVKGGVK